MLSKFVLPIVAFILTLVFGFWVSQVGKPYNGLLFNIHKLIALGAVIATIVQFTKVLKNVDSLALIIVLLVVAALCVIALFASGALMSIGKVDYALMLAIHRIAPVVLVIAMVIIFIMLKGGVS
ncbi:MAG: hypothetical protein JXR84_03635 [Anaerolineae bacterium]|nr:hypothetical protein [Anaerolineae bacterium]